MSAESIKLTDPHDHPEPHTMKWTQAEMDYINNRVETAVRQALEQSTEQEPVAWITQGGKGWLRWHKSYDDNKDSVPLYTQPQEAAPRKPLTLETIYETIIYWDEGGGKRSRRELARRIVDLYTQPQEAAPLQSTEQEPVAKTVWIVGGDTFQCVCATSEDANRLIADLGINTPSLYPSVIEVPLLSYTTPPQPQEASPSKPTEQEPVAWLHWLYGPVRVFLNKDEAMMELDRLNREYPVDDDSRQMKSLYTQPQEAAPRKPLTRGQIREIEVDVYLNPSFDYITPAEQLCRAIEAAHGITGEQK